MDRLVTSVDTGLTAEYHWVEARASFNYYRKLMRPGAQWGPFTAILNAHYQQFYEDFMLGKRPKLVVEAPPQHGKSWSAEDFVAWVAGKNPEMKTIFASYSGDLGTRCNLALQRALLSSTYQDIFPGTRIGEQNWMCNSELVEFCGHAGSFRNTTVQSAINGMELHLGVIDDPHKGRAEALSKTTRDRVWHWFTDDWYARFNANNAMLIVMTRWHVDDLVGRFITKMPGVKLLRFPAIAEADVWWRQRGQPLFPEVKPLDFLLERKQVMSQGSWESEYQQNPIIIGGGIIPVEKLRIIPIMPDRNRIKRSVRYVDKAGSAGSGAHTAMVLMSMLEDGRFIIEDVVRGQWSALEREETLLKVAQADRDAHPRNYEVVVEQEPGSGGKESAEASIRMLRGFRCFADRVTGSKELRAEPFAAQVQGSNVWMVAGRWVEAYIDEAEAWPNGKYRDQIDASSGAFNRMTSKPVYNLDAMAS
jgi:predicted phage terminase large subunit-like protein